MNKVCFKCGHDKKLSEFYLHKQMKDGHLNKCKDCTRKDTKSRFSALLNNPIWVESERSRHRDKYYRLNYKDKHKPSFESKKKTMQVYKSRYPEKYYAKSLSANIKFEKGVEKHHWSYNIQHAKEIIPLMRKDHSKIHRYLIYDPSAKMYRNKNTNELLDTREKHIYWIWSCMNNKFNSCPQK